MGLRGCQSGQGVVYVVWSLTALHAFIRGLSREAVMMGDYSMQNICHSNYVRIGRGLLHQRDLGGGLGV